MKKRIWELDALRGLCILGVVAVHLIYDLVELYGILEWEYPTLFSWIKQWGGVLFLLISGISATLGSHSLRRGVIVLGCGMAVSLVTAGMYWFGLAGKEIMIYFGVLHCLGFCMILWPLFRRAPRWVLGGMGLVLAALGLYLKGLPPIGTNLLVPLGLVGEDFATSDYFPLLPNFGFFLIGAFLGRTVYKSKESLLPEWEGRNILICFLQLCGRQSLWIYLIHQIVISAVCYLILLML